MLSIVDIKKELGENIYVYPVHSESIKSNSIDLRVSKFAWSLNEKKTIYNNGYITIPPHDTALIYTQESLYVSNKIGGTYHSKVTLVSKGLGHIGTTLDSQYIGNSIVAVHNHSNKSIRLKVGEEFVTLQLFYLHTPDYDNTPAHDNEPGHPRMLNSFPEAEIDEYIKWRDENTWCKRKKDLYQKMVESEEFVRCQKEFRNELKKFNKSFWIRYRGVFKILLYMILLLIIISVPTYILNLGKWNNILVSIFEKICFPLIMSVVIPLLILEIKR